MCDHENDEGQHDIERHDEYGWVDDWIRANDPATQFALAEEDDSLAAQETYEWITSRPWEPDAGFLWSFRRRFWTRLRVTIRLFLRPYRSRKIYLGTVLAVLAAGGGVAYATVFAQPTRHLDVACYSRPSLHASASVLSADARGPLADCAGAWLKGDIPDQSPRPPPPLRACVLHSGSVGVFPASASSDLCERLGLSPLTPSSSPSPTSTSSGGSSPGALPTLQLRDQVVRDLSSACLNAAGASHAVQQVITHLGLRGWKIKVIGTFSSSRPCASPGFDEIARIVYLVPVPADGR